jgi:hypothetical protein
VLCVRFNVFGFLSPSFNRWMHAIQLWRCGHTMAKLAQKSEISLLSASPEKNHISLKLFSRIWTTRPIARQKTQDVHSRHAVQNIPPTTPHKSLNPIISPQIDRNSEHYCAAQARSTHHQHQFCCKFVTCYMLFLFIRDSFTEVLSKIFKFFKFI